LGLAAEYGLAAATLPAKALPGGICTRPAEGPAGVFLAGAPAAVAMAQVAWARRDLPAFQALIDLPACCVSHGSDAPGGDLFPAHLFPEQLFPAHQGTVDLPESAAAHPLLAPLGISALPVAPCRLDCPSAIEAAAQWLELAAGAGYATEAGWLRECFSWSISWSELHGVTEVKTPLFKMCFQTGSNSRARLIRRAGTAAAVEGSAAGLTFPYAAPARQSRMIEIGGLV
jgi:hypothetical protein